MIILEEFQLACLQYVNKLVSLMAANQQGLKWCHVPVNSFAMKWDPATLQPD